MAGAEGWLVIRTIATFKALDYLCQPNGPKNKIIKSIQSWKTYNKELMLITHTDLDM